MNLERSATPRVSSVPVSDLMRTLVEDFDYTVTGQTTFHPFLLPQMPDDWGIGVIVGASGSGKSTLLSEFGIAESPVWRDGVALADHFSTPIEARDKMFAAGLGSVPDWVKPYEALSNGQRFRADLARSIESGAVIDEFTSVVDRTVAVSASKSLSRYVKANGIRRMVIATCHRDVLPHLEPDWIIDTDSEEYIDAPRGWLHRPEMVVEVYPATRAAWQLFAAHHYISADLPPIARNFIATVNGEIAGFVCAMSMPNGAMANAWRESRLVVLPDFQGFGLGPRLSEYIASGFLASGKRYFSKTAHPRLGEWRERSPLWRATSKNRMRRKDQASLDRIDRVQRFQSWGLNPNRLTYSHEYIGP